MIVLYKPGGHFTKDGVAYTRKLFNEQSFEHELENGWYLSIDDFPKPELAPAPKAKKSAKKTSKKKQADLLSDASG